MRAALIKDGIVRNIILVGKGPFTITGYEVIPLEDNDRVNIGDLWDGTTFQPSPAIEDPAPASPTLEALQEQQLAQAEAIAFIFEMLTGGAS